MGSGSGSGIFPEDACGFVGWPSSDVKKLDVPKPILMLEGFEPSPSRTPHLLVSPGSLRRGEQILQVSVILRLVSVNVHGDSLKQSELI